MAEPGSLSEVGEEAALSLWLSSELLLLLVHRDTVEEQQGHSRKSENRKQATFLYPFMVFGSLVSVTVTLMYF